MLRLHKTSQYQRFRFVLNKYCSMFSPSKIHIEYIKLSWKKKLNKNTTLFKVLKKNVYSTFDLIIEFSLYINNLYQVPCTKALKDKLTLLHDYYCYMQIYFDSLSSCIDMDVTTCQIKWVYIYHPELIQGAVIFNILAWCTPSVSYYYLLHAT